LLLVLFSIGVVFSIAVNYVKPNPQAALEKVTQTESQLTWNV